MNETTTTIARIYCSQGEQVVSTIIDYLYGELKVKGVSVFRGIEGFGKSGVVHTRSIVDLSMDLPIVIEFYDAHPRILKAIDHIQSIADGIHIISWPVNEH